MGAALGLKPGIPIPTGALDAHWDALAGSLGDVVNVGHIDLHDGFVGRAALDPACPAWCRVRSSQKLGIEAGLAAVGDTFDPSPGAPKHCSCPFHRLNTIVRSDRLTAWFGQR